jgi:hypothetical protein
MWANYGLMRCNKVETPQQRFIIVAPNLPHHLHHMTILAQITCDDVRDTAYE